MLGPSAQNLRSTDLETPRAVREASTRVLEMLTIWADPGPQHGRAADPGRWDWVMARTTCMRPRIQALAPGIWPSRSDLREVVHQFRTQCSRGLSIQSIVGLTALQKVSTIRLADEGVADTGHPNRD